MGLALGGLLPCIARVIRHTVPPERAGSVLGLSTSAQYVGQVTGPLLGGVEWCDDANGHVPCGGASFVRSSTAVSRGKAA